MINLKKLIVDYFGKNGLVEIGCGKGVFLEIFKSSGIDIIGFDPAGGGNNPSIIKYTLMANLSLLEE